MIQVNRWTTLRWTTAALTAAFLLTAILIAGTRIVQAARADDKASDGVVTEKKTVRVIEETKTTETITERTIERPAKNDKAASNVKTRDGQPKEQPSTEKGDVKRWARQTWRMLIALDTPDGKPRAVQFAIVDEDPVPAFRARIERMRTYNRRQMAKETSEAGREQLRAVQMTVAWDLGFSDVTGDKLYLMLNRPIGDHSISSNGPDGRKWIVTKTVNDDGKPVCWRLPIEVKTGKQIDVTLTKKNAFDLRAIYDDVMREPNADQKERTARQD